MSDRTKGILLAVVATVIWGSCASFARLVSDTGVAQITVMAFRAPLIAIILGAFISITRGPSALAVPRRMLACYAVVGVCSIALNATGYNTSCTYLTLPQAVILHYTYPMLTMLGDCFLTRERPTVTHFISGVLILVGMYIGFGMGDVSTSVDMFGVFCGALSVFGMASGNILTRTLMKSGRGDAFVQLFYANISCAIIIWSLITINGGWSNALLITPRTAGLMLVPTLGAGLVGFILVYSAMKYISATLTSLICSLEVVTTLAVMPIFLGSAPSLKEAAGAATILFAVALSTRARAAKSAG